jgi:hypothetical protein
VASTCDGATTGQCPSSKEACLPSVAASDNPSLAEGIWTYCVTHDGYDDQYTSMCPSTYPVLRIFGNSYNDTRVCDPCTCDPPVGSTCESLVTVYSDATCSNQIGSVMATADGSMCVDIAAGTPLGSKSATAPIYMPGACQPHGGGVVGSPNYDAPQTFCCLD